MGKLPATSYVRLVDIWLIFVQLYPFIEVVLFTIIEMHIEEEITNNHGRLKRFVPEAKKEVCTFRKIKLLVNVLLMYLIQFLCSNILGRKGDLGKMDRPKYAPNSKILGYVDVKLGE